MFPVFTSFVSMPKIDCMLGICLKPRYVDDLVTYAIIEEINGKRHSITKIEESSFILIAAGQMRSDANPEGINYFEEFDIPFCEISYDSLFQKHTTYCRSVENLWKLRYQKKPNDLTESSTLGAENSGWAEGKNCPSERQMEMLSEFGMSTINKYAKGEKCFQLLKSISDPAWVSLYIR